MLDTDSETLSTEEAASYVKIASISIFAFDYIQTLPAEYRFYRRQKGFLKLSLACWLFVAVRYLGMLTILLSTVGGFSRNFTQKSCDRYYISVPVTKVLAAIASHAVFIFRTYAISNRNRKILIFLLVIGIPLSAVELIAPVVISRTGQLGATGNCVSDLAKGTKSWIQYMCQVIFDVIILIITSRYLLTGLRSNFTKALWESQTVYFFLVTAVNILNLVFFVLFSHSIKSTMMAPLGMAFTAIFSSRVILDPFQIEHIKSSFPSTRADTIVDGPIRFGPLDPAEHDLEEQFITDFRMDHFPAKARAREAADIEIGGGASWSAKGRMTPLPPSPTTSEDHNHGRPTSL